MLRASRFAATLGPATVLVVAAACSMGSGCSVRRTSEPSPTYDSAVGALIADRCAPCHSASAPAGGWRASSYLEVIACLTDGRPAVLPGSDDAPIVRALASATHAALLTAGERDLISAWVRAGTPKLTGTAHPPSFVDPRSDQSHGRILRSQRWSPMLDRTDAASCGRCHDGSPTRPEGVTASAPGAPACTTCHQEPGGPLGCSTCHGRGVGEGKTTPGMTKAYPPRDPCFFPGDGAASSAHAAHVDGPHAMGVACSTCHPAPGMPVIGGQHGNGTLEVRLDPAVAGASASFDASTKVCTTACHARAGGARPAPAWAEKAPMGCNDCHSSPPANHFAGACSGCHRETNASGTGFLTAQPKLHVNGHVDLGDGSGTCGSCHGNGDSAWPTTNAHRAHENPAAAMAAPCASCHVVPTAFGKGTAHPRGGPATVAFSGLAVARGAPATFTGGSCREVYCHGGGLEGTVAATPSWIDATGSARACGACHGTPPAAPHVASPACELCHRDGVVTPAGARIAPEWTVLHVNGVVDRGGN